MSKLHNRENDTVAVNAPVAKSDVALREEAIQAFWEEHDIFHKTLEKEAPNGEFIFYDGPPFATGLPHYGHILAGTIKDAIPRFWTMRGYRVPRKWGWDCHGLPLENLIEKKLGLATKRDIEAYGVQNFNEAARDTVMEYADDWARIIPRMGRWADMEDDYKTMDPSYTESVWSVFKTLDQKGLVFEGFKSMHLCPRCGTTLSNFEVNQGYKDIKDIAVTVKLPLLDEAGNVTDTSLLVWTTTPWTLPGNMAAAVNKDFEYAKVKITTEQGDEFCILAKGRLTQFGDIAYEVVEEMKGSELIGRSYQPPFAYFKDRDFEGKKNAWKIWHADYVEIGNEGTGAVHIAPAYGEDDMQLAKANNIPIVHHVNTDGHFIDFVTDFAGQLVKPKDDDKAEVSHLDADIEVLKKLQEAGKIFKKENITHSYPHCWRCDTPLLNYATTSWFVNVPKIKDELVAANNAVHWVPEHVGRARFGNWLEGARDWAISRQRYWGAPLPIWKHPKTGAYKVFGTLKELQKSLKKSGNTYYKMRHGEADHNLSHVMSSLVDTEHHLTEKGKSQVWEAAAGLKEKSIDYIYVSPLIRTQETAHLVAEVIGLPAERIIVDNRLRENAGGIFEGKPIEDWYTYRNKLSDEQILTDRYVGGESWQDIRKRMSEVLFEVEAKYEGKNILFISHGMPLRLMKWSAGMLSHQEMVQKWKDDGDFPLATVDTIAFTPFPHNDLFELDYHRPYIDQVTVVDEAGETLVRIPDVFDCWFESGSMPYAQQHYLGEALPDFDPAQGKGFPAQFIAEGLDQTRGWFYSLIVLGVALFGKSPYENVIVNGLALAEDGKKMSKSLRNYPDPMELADRVGVDAMRYYLLTAPIIRGEDLNFSEKEVLELQRKNIGRLHNVLAMYELYADGTVAHGDSSHVLDRWIVARLNELIADTTAGYESYELDRASRPIVDFIDDLSVWYLRRSRERFKGDNTDDKALALGTLRFALRELAKVMAPVMPFYAEYLYRAVREEGEPESVHLCDWPQGGAMDVDLITTMTAVRNIITFALEARTKAGIKVRQPLQTLRVASRLLARQEEFTSLIEDEVNIKEVIFDAEIPTPVVLDTNVTPELKAEGDVREFIRAVQELRKLQGLNPKDQIQMNIHTSESGMRFLEIYIDEIRKVVGAVSVSFSEADGQKITAGDHSYIVEIIKN